MAAEEVMLTGSMSPELTAGLMGGFTSVVLLGVVLLWIGFYVYTALATQSIYRKSGHKRPWMAWIPIANIVPMLELGGFHWAWVFLVLGAMIPLVGFIASIALFVLTIICFWRIFDKAGYPGALALLMIIPIANLIVMGIVAWQKKTYKKVSKRKK